MKGFWNILSLIHGGNLLCTQRCDQCGILVDDYRALKQASTWEQHFTILSGHFIPTSDNFALNGGLVLGIHRESSRLGSQGSFFAPGTNTRIACYHASLHLLNMLPLSLLPLVGLMCRHGPVFQLASPLIFGVGLHTVTARRLGDYPLSGDWCVGDFDQVHGTEGSGWRAGFFRGRTVFKSARKAPIWSNISIWYMNAWKSWFHCLSFPKLRRRWLPLIFMSSGDEFDWNGSTSKDWIQILQDICCRLCPQMFKNTAPTSLDFIGRFSLPCGLPCSFRRKQSWLVLLSMPMELWQQSIEGRLWHNDHFGKIMILGMSNLVQNAKT